MNNIINKSDLISEIASETQYKKGVVSEIVNALIAKIPQYVANGNIVQFEGFGSFDVAKRAPKKRYDFGIEEVVITPEKTIPIFRPGKTFINIVAESEAGDIDARNDIT